MDALGRHLLLELKDCNKEVLDDIDVLRNTLQEAAYLAGASVVGEAFHRFNPHGISGVLIIAESHLFIHTWPEYGYAAVDIFTCGDTIRAQRAATLLVDKLDSQSHSTIELRRGVLG